MTEKPPVENRKRCKEDKIEKRKNEEAVDLPQRQHELSLESPELWDKESPHKPGNNHGMPGEVPSYLPEDKGGDEGNVHREEMLPAEISPAQIRFSSLSP